MHELGATREVAGEFAAASEAWEKELALRLRLKDVQGEAEAISSIGEATERLGNREQALALYLRALRIESGVHDPCGQAETLYRIGINYDHAGFKPIALRYLERAQQLFQAAGNRGGYADVLSRAAMVHADLGQHSRALQLLEQAAALHRQAGDLRGEARDAYNLGLIHIWYLPDPNLSFEWSSKALALERQAGYQALETNTLLSLGLADQAGGRLPEAIARMEQAIALVEQERGRLPTPELRISYFQTKENYYAHLIGALLELARRSADAGLVARAFAASERRRNPALVEALGGSSDANPPADNLRGLLDEDSLLLEYTDLVDSRFLLAVSASGVQAYHLPHADGREAVRDCAVFTRCRVHCESDPEYRGALTRLSRILLPAQAAPLFSKRRILVAIDGMLSAVPFAALPNPASGGRPLGLDREIVMIPSLRAIALMRSRAATRVVPSKTVAVFADPVFSADDPRVGRRRRLGLASVPPSPTPPLARLLFTRREAEAILALVPPARALRALDFDASRQTLTSPALADYRVVHIATHGLLDRRSAQPSALALSLVDPAGAPQPGILHLKDIEKLRLAADLVVLAGCETALGKRVSGEGMLGFARALLVAGAQRALVSLWKVDDEAAAEFMRHFYTALLGAPKLRPPEALRAARLAMRQQPRWAAPYYWAGYALHGDWR